MIMSFENKSPRISKDVFIANSSEIIGNIVIEKDVSIWFNVVLRGDKNTITIKECTNIQDGTVVHVDEDYPTLIGKNVTVGHNAIIHGCTVGNNTLIGMGSILMDGCCIGENSIVAAGSLVSPGKKFPDGVLIMGSPAKIIRNLSEKEIEDIYKSAQDYSANSKKYIK